MWTLRDIPHLLPAAIVIYIIYTSKYNQIAEIDQDDHDNDVDKLLDQVIEGRFKIGHEIGDGYGGFVRQGIDLSTNEDVAIKFALGDQCEMLKDEHWNYIELGADDPEILTKGIPNVFLLTDYGEYKVLVMKKLGKSIYELWNARDDRKFSKKTVFRIALQVLDIIAFIHKKQLIFHDIKPDNWVVGNTKETENKIYFVDFGFSEFYTNDEGIPLPPVKIELWRGTIDYMSVDALNKYSQVRKDDLESIGLVLLELNGAVLPWAEHITDDMSMSQSAAIVFQERDKISIELIYDETDEPQVFIDYFNYLDTLKYDEEPDYEMLKRLFSDQLTIEELEDEDFGLQ